MDVSAVIDFCQRRIQRFENDEITLLSLLINDRCTRHAVERVSSVDICSSYKGDLLRARREHQSDQECDLHPRHFSYPFCHRAPLLRWFRCTCCTSRAWFRSVIGSNELSMDDISRVENYVRHFIKHAPSNPVDHR